MSTTLSSPANTSVKMRFQEPYVSEGLNKKLHGLLPAGIVRGGKLVTGGLGFLVTIQADPDKGDSVYAYVDGDNNHLTFRQAGDVNLDLTALASSVVYIAAYIDYTISNPTSIEWRAYSEAELFGGSPVAEAGEVVVLGAVNVPASGPIPSGNIAPLRRMDAWADVSPGLVPWKQVVKNGHFEQAKPGAIPTAGAIYGWEDQLVSGNVHLPEVATTAPLSGPHELRLQGASSAVNLVLYGSQNPAVKAGDFVRASIYARGSSFAGVSAGDYGLVIEWYTEDRVYISADYVNITDTGTFAYTQYDEVFEAPATAASFKYAIAYLPSGDTPTGDIFIDSVRVWVQTSAPLENDIADRDVYSFENFSSMILAPRLASGGVAGAVDDSVKIRHGGTSGSPSIVSLLLERLGSGGGLDLDGVEMGITLQRIIKDLGGALLGSAADALTPRIASDYAPVATTKYTLMWEMPVESGSAETIRIYASETGMATSAGLIITVNAAWDGLVWNRDVAAGDAFRFEINGDRASFRFRDGGESDGWGDGTGLWNQGLSIHYTSSFGGGLSIETDGRFRYSGGVGSFNRPTSTKTFAGSISSEATSGRVLYSNSVAKAYGVVQTDGAGAVQLDDGMNISAITIDGSGNLAITMGTALASANYVVHVTGQNGNLLTGVSLNETISSFDLDIKQINAAADVDLSIAVAHFCFTVFGRNA